MDCVQFTEEVSQKDFKSVLETFYQLVVVSCCQLKGVEYKIYSYIPLSWQHF